MMQKIFILALIVLLPVTVHAEVSVKTVDFLQHTGVAVNAAGPLWVQTDVERNRIIVANTLTSSLTIIDGETHAVSNIPMPGRALQHLKAEAMTYGKQSGNIYLIGTKSFHIISPGTKKSETVQTNVQFESITVDEAGGNVFVTGRESKEMGFYDIDTHAFEMRTWLDHEEKLINLNQTPPPPIRKVISDGVLNNIIAVDGFTSSLHLFDAKTGEALESRSLELTGGGRWHLAGYNEQTHCLYLVVETARRRVIEAAKIDVINGHDVVVPLPEYTEGVGITYNPVRDEIYIPYDNFPSVHVVDFTNGGALDEIEIPAFGNDASAIDLDNDILYIASWAQGEIDVIDLGERKLLKRIEHLGIIPHMFTMSLNPNTGCIYFPKGATAVNGTFGAAITVLDPLTEKTEKIHLGWAPIDLIALEERESFLVFSSENQFAEVRANGQYDMHDLPYDYPVQAVRNPSGDIYLSYGPHQSYWPTVYIWGAKNGVLTIDADDFSFYDRRIPRQAHEMVLDDKGVLYFTQNNWGGEVQFVGRLMDEVRLYESGKRIALADTVVREITQRILEYDAEADMLYLVRVGEGDEDPSILQVVDPDSQHVAARVLLGLTAADLVFDDAYLYIANFESDNVSVINKNDFAVQTIPTDDGPLKLCRHGDGVYAINHMANTLQEVKEGGRSFELPHEGMPDNIFTWHGNIVITSHSSEALFITMFDIASESFTLLHEETYPFGDTRFDSANVSFYVNGQFGDAVFSITCAETDSAQRLWVTDFLAGKLFILDNQ
jgi:YVTN family beta-propeller protein